MVGTSSASHKILLTVDFPMPSTSATLLTDV
jgi:hypothetical protein